MIRRFIGKLVSDKKKGFIDYYRFPERRSAWGGPFNGQTGRCALYASLMDAVKPELIIETGTYYGTTTELLAESGVRVVTIEGNERNYGFARARLRRCRNVEIYLGDSRAQMRSVLDLEGRNAGETAILAYLDAHWNADLPLAEELDILFSYRPNAVVMIDDFEVPDDAGYQYDDYGPGRALTAEYIEPAIRKHDLVKFYPAMRSNEESGACRGCVVLAHAPSWFEPLGRLSQLRRL